MRKLATSPNRHALCNKINKINEDDILAGDFKQLYENKWREDVLQLIVNLQKTPILNTMFTLFKVLYYQTLIYIFLLIVGIHTAVYYLRV